MTQRFPSSGTISSLRDTARVLPSAITYNLNNPAIRRIAEQNRPAANVANSQISFSDLYQRGLRISREFSFAYTNITGKREFVAVNPTPRTDLVAGLFDDFPWEEIGLDTWNPAYQCDVTYTVHAPETNSTLNFHTGSRGSVYSIQDRVYGNGVSVFWDATANFTIRIPSGFGFYGINYNGVGGIPIDINGSFGPNVNITIENNGNLFGYGGDGAGGSISGTGGPVVGTVGGGRGTGSVDTGFFQGPDLGTPIGDPLGQQGANGTSSSAAADQAAEYISGTGGMGFATSAPITTVSGGAVNLGSGRSFTVSGNTFYSQSLGVAGVVSYGPSGGSVMSGAIAALAACSTPTVSGVSSTTGNGVYNSSTSGSVNFYQLSGGAGGSWGQAGGGITGTGIGGSQPGYYLRNTGSRPVNLTGSGNVRGLRLGP